MASIFRGHDIPERPIDTDTDLKQIYAQYRKCIHANKIVSISVGEGLKAIAKQSEEKTVRWNNPAVYSAFLTLPFADSITCDPHKMGYIPYPAGLVAFRNGIVTELMTQRAQYFSDEQLGIHAVDTLPDITSIGSHILEGSKPGAAATACWLSHTVIPLTYSGHGQLIRTVLLSARKLAFLLTRHRKYFKQIDGEVCGESTQEKHDSKIDWSKRCQHPFTFFPLNEPDTNIVCFVALPMCWDKGALQPIDESLERINEINQGIYRQLSIIPMPPAPSGTIPERHSRLSYEQPFFVSRTTFTHDQYSYKSIGAVLDKMRVNERDYIQHGLFVLRSTVMNPLYAVAEKEGKDYLMDFVRELHLCARRVMSSM